MEAATAEAREAIQLQALNAGEDQERDLPAFGTKTSNAQIVSRAMMRMLEEPKKPAEQHSREVTDLSRKVDKYCTPGNTGGC